ncbi:MAG TPA: methyltransferase domain-containing protein [Acidimicrobiales bacterium]|nr:methyltransferase domain-containing protein [Acidimicrobiales bacterium]
MDTETDYEPAAHYDRVHEAWLLIMGEEFHYGFFATPDTPLGDATDALTKHMLERARIAAGDRVLDVGCGTGHQSCKLAEERGCSVLGITTSASGVAAASALAAARGLGDVRFEQRDGTANGLGAASFDVTWVLESSHLMRDRTALLSECARVLAPGGRLTLCDIVRRREIPFPEVRARRQDFATLRAAFGDAHMEPLDAYTATLADLGMTVTDSTDISMETLPTFAAWRANIEANRAAVAELLGTQGMEDFEAATHILEAFWQDGTLGYGILAAVKNP